MRGPRYLFVLLLLAVSCATTSLGEEGVPLPTVAVDEDEDTSLEAPAAAAGGEKELPAVDIQQVSDSSVDAAAPEEPADLEGEEEGGKEEKDVEEDIKTEEGERDDDGGDDAGIVDETIPAHAAAAAAHDSDEQQEEEGDGTDTAEEAVAAAEAEAAAKAAVAAAEAEAAEAEAAAAAEAEAAEAEAEAAAAEATAAAAEAEAEAAAAKAAAAAAKAEAEAAKAAAAAEAAVEAEAAETAAAAAAVDGEGDAGVGGEAETPASKAKGSRDGGFFAAARRRAGDGGRRNPLGGMLKSYDALLEEHYLKMSFAQATSLGVVGDTIAQRLERRWNPGQRFELKRTMHAGILSMLIDGIFTPHWYNVVDQINDAMTLPAAFVKALAASAIYGPFANGMFLAGARLLRYGLKAPFNWGEWGRQLKICSIRDFEMWPPFHILGFWLLPKHWRPLAGDLGGLALLAVISSTDLTDNALSLGQRAVPLAARWVRGAAGAVGEKMGTKGRRATGAPPPAGG